jgi:hypothetical protein
LGITPIVKLPRVRGGSCRRSTSETRAALTLPTIADLEGSMWSGERWDGATSPRYLALLDSFVAKSGLQAEMIDAHLLEDIVRFLPRCMEEHGYYETLRMLQLSWQTVEYVRDLNRRFRISASEGGEARRRAK